MSRLDSPLRLHPLEDRLAPAAGDLDPTFGNGGKLTAPLQGVADTVSEVAVQPDGKFVLAGETTSFDFAITRLNPDGSPDTSFGTGGSTAIDFRGASDFANAQTIQPDGKIVLAGSAFVGNGADGSALIDMAVTRLTADGQLDGTFDAGKVLIPVAGRQAIATAVATQPDGAVVVAGSAYDPITGQSVAVVARLTADGQLDPTFGTGGVTTFQVGASNSLEAVAIQPDGRIVVVGTTGATREPGGDLVVARLRADGQLDPAFGTGGTAVVDFGGADSGSVVAIQSDGRIVVGGQTGNLFAAARLNADGSPDSTFGTGGKTTLDVGGTAQVNAAVIQSDGKILLGGDSGGYYAADFAVARLTADGLPDPTFGNGGRVSVDFGKTDIARTVVLQPDDKILLAGGTGDYASLQHTFAVARLLGNSRPPVLVGGLADGTAVALTPVGGTCQPTGTVKFFPGVPVNIRTATADVNGDGVPDLIGGAGPGAMPSVMVLDGKTGQFLTSPLAFEPSFTGGVFVAAADLDGDGRAEIIATPDQGGGPNVVILSLNPDGTITTRASFFALGNPAFRGGARPAVGDVNGDGTPDVAIGAGFLGGPNVEVHDGKALMAGKFDALVGSGFFAFDGSDAQTLRNGVFLSVGDVNGDGFADIIAGGGPGGGPRVLVLDGKMLAAGNVAGAYAGPVANFFFGDDTNRGGVRVAAANIDGDNKADLVVGSGEGLPSQVRVYLGKDCTGSGEPSAAQNLDPFGQTLPGGVFVG
jgi:uncharacterized delta-60 repeat protein